MTTYRARMLSAGFLGGLALGYVAWSATQRRYRRDLFNARPVARLAALGYLGGQASPTTARLLHDYLRWERHAALRRRARVLLRRVERQLG